MNSKIEIWKPVKNYPDYQVSNFGNVMGKNDQLLKAGKDKDGYLLVVLCQNKLNKSMRVHRLVAETFDLPKRADQYSVDHIDGCKSNNNINNLRWANRSEQQFNQDIYKNNTTGYKGVYFTKGLKKPYRSMISVHGKSQFLGYFQTPEQASQAREKFAQEHHGQFYRPIINNYGTININN